MPLFTDVAGTVRVDCTVPDDDDTVLRVIPRSRMTGFVSVTSATHRMNRCSKPSAVYSTIDYSKLHETASAAYRCASC